MILLVRHTAIAKHWTGRCYGQSDVGLSRDGTAAAKTLARSLALWRPDYIVHSDMRRTRILAERLAVLTSAPCAPDPDWRERDFGEWEGRSWNAIYRETGNAMDGMLDDPQSFRPGGGETTTELADRVAAALARIPTGRTIIITHGGPIAAIIGRAQSLPETAWPALIPACGQQVEIAHPRSGAPRRL